MSGPDNRMDADDGAAFQLFRVGLWGLVAMFLTGGAFVAVTIPFHASDALAYGEWSRLIGESWGFRFEGVGPAFLHRPLLYVVQGWLWGVFGFHEWIGRLLAVGFTVLLVASVAWLTARRPAPRTSAALAAALLVLIPDVREGVASGLTDVPLAALVALVAALSWWRRPGMLQPGLVGVASAAAVLAKPTALVALAALCGAHAIGVQGVRLLVLRCAPVVLGAGVALLYDFVQARHVGTGLFDFLRAGSTGFYADLAADARFDQLVRLDWLGGDLRPLVVFALIYAGLRVCRVEHRAAALVAVTAGPAVSICLPLLADDASTPFESAGTGLGFAVLSLSLVGAVLCPSDLAPSRAWLARLAIVGGAPLAVWLWAGAYDTRLGSAAWPGLLALIAATVTPAVLGLCRVSPLALAAPGAAVLALAAYSYTDLDGLGPEQWREYASLDLEQLFDVEQTRAIVLPQLSKTLQVITPELGSTGRLHTAEGAFRFSFPGRVTQGYPGGCSDLRGFRVFVLLTDDGTKAYMHDALGIPAEPGDWAACADPRLTQLSDGAGGYAAFRVG